jgi:hypothetical protein
MRSSFLRVFVVGVAALVVAGCGGGDGGGKSQTPANVTIASGNGQTAVAGTALPTPLGVSVTSASGKPVAAAAVTWAVTAGGGSVTPASSTTDSTGIARTSWTLGTTPGSNQATATVRGIPVVTFSATATTGATASVTVTSPVEKIYEGDAVQLTAIARDAHGNVISGKSFTWTSSQPEWAPVSATGLLDTWGQGDVTVTATVDDHSGTANLTVSPVLATVAVGAKELVFDWSEDRCEDLDLPDTHTRVVRAEDGSLVLFNGDAPRNYVSRGADFDSLRRDCSQPVLSSRDLPTAETFENQEWLWTVYREGSTWHGLIHNEFHDPIASTCMPGVSTPGNPCWYNSITYAVSTDGGRSFTKPLAPRHTVAPPPSVWTPPAVPPPPGVFYFYGYDVSNILSGPDGYFYALVSVQPRPLDPEFGICPIRTNALGDPSSWRAWDGSGYTRPLPNPYVTGATAPVCSYLHWPIGNASIVYDTYLERYLLAGGGEFDVNGRQTCGYYYQLSADLIHWSHPQLIVAVRFPWCTADPQGQDLLETAFVGGPAIIDHGDVTPNFERAGRAPHLYYMRFNDQGLDRDLMRVPLTFTRTN